MKNGRATLAILFACVLAVLAITTASAQESGIDAQQSGVFDLAITDIETEPFSAAVGEEVTVYVTYENLLPAPLPPGALLDLVITVTNVQTREVVQTCRQPVDLAGLTSTDRTQRIPFPQCPVTVTEPDTHLIRAEFVATGGEPGTGPYELIVGDVDAGNNGELSTIIPSTAASDDNLPVELARIFAGLAIFFAVMALVAAGTEVIIDSLKVGVGLKRKVTTMEALDRMEKYLPGELAALSVSAAMREQFKRMAREMRAALDTTLTSTSDFVAMRNQVINGEFGAAYRAAEVLLPDNGELVQEDLYRFKKQLFSFANRLTASLENQLQLQPQAVQPLRDQVAQQISLFDGRNPGHFLELLFATLQETHFWAVQIADGWLQEQEENLFKRTSAVVMAQYETDVRPILEGVGFSPHSVEQTKRELSSRLRIVETGVSQSTDTFVSSVKHVLDAVELRRFETQSPARKVWRILRTWDGGQFPPTRLRGILGPSMIIAALALYVTWLGQWLNSAATPIRYIENRILGSAAFPWLPWFLLYLGISFGLILLLTLYRKARKSLDQPWVTGLYGATALAILIGALLLLILWVLQADPASRVTGQLSLFHWIQPWWSLLILFSLILLALLLIVGQFAKLLYDRLVRSAVRQGQLSEDKRLLDNATVLRRVETLSNLIRFGFDVTQVNPDSFGVADSVATYEEVANSQLPAGFEFSAETTAQYIMVRSDQQRDEETSRLRILRVISIIVGLVLAYLLQIDVLNLLGEAFPGTLESLNVTVVTGEALHTWRSWLSVEKSVTVGIILTGFAASAGSAFWHDRLDKLQASKKGAQAAAALLNQASQVSETVTRG